MIWKTRTHQFTATVCQRTGENCPALAQIARTVVQAMDTAAPATTPDFEFDGSSDLTHCAEGCTARFRAQKNQIRVFCGSSYDASLEALDDYADMMFGTDMVMRPAGMLAAPPCAMLEVTAFPTKPVARTEQQVAL